MSEYRKQINFAKGADKHLKPKYLDPKRYQRYLKKLLRIKNSTGNNKQGSKNEILQYKEFVEFDLKYSRPELDMKLYPCISPGFDNSSRRQEGLWTLIFHGSTPVTFKEWVEGKLRRFTPYSNDENFLFINAWNEWAEGNHLEPDEKWGLKYLGSFERRPQ